MDIKTTGLSFEIMEEAFAQAREGRLHILGIMMDTLDTVRGELSPYAPRMQRIKIDPDKIGALIGPGGKTIRGIVEETGAKIDVEDDGTVFVTAPPGDGMRRAIQMIEGLTKQAEVGEIYLGKVVRIMPYGAFVQILPGKDGLVHVSELVRPPRRARRGRGQPGRRDQRHGDRRRSRPARSRSRAAPS